MQNDSEFIIDAPKDGNSYGRNNGKWVKVPPRYPMGVTDNPSVGVYIEDVDGMFWPADLWNFTSIPNSVAVITETHRFGIAIAEAVSKVFASRGTNLNMLYITEDSSVANVTYNGAQKTKDVVNSSYYDSTKYIAFDYCYNYIFPNGRRGYLGASGEIMLFLRNKVAVNECLNLFGLSFYSGNYISLTLAYYYPDSSYGSYGQLWKAGLVSDVPTLEKGNTYNGYSCLPFCEL